MKPPKQTVFYSLFLIFLIAACGTPSASTEPAIRSEFDAPGSLSTAIVETAAIAQTQTAVAIPTSTQTPLPTRTATITPTPTPTFLFFITTETFTPTPMTDVPFVSIPGGGTSGATGESALKPDKLWACLGVGKTPANYTTFQPGTHFTVFWTLMNVGSQPWTVNTIDFVYRTGYRHENTKIQDLTQNIGPGGKIKVSAGFVAPSAPGEYNTYFTLQVGNRQFCGIRNVFVVEGK